MRDGQRDPVVHVHDAGKRVERECSLKLRQRLVDAIFREEQQERIKIMSIRIIRVELDRAPILRLGFIPLPSRGQRAASRRVRFGGRIIKLKRLARGLVRQHTRLLEGNACAVVTYHVVSVREAGVGQCIIGISGNRLSEEINTLLQAIRASPIPLLPPLQIQTISLRASGAGITQVRLPAAVAI